MITDLVEIRRLTQRNEAENLDFRRYLKSHHHSDGPFQILANEIAARIDCQSCANCCRHTIVSVTSAEIEGIAKHLHMEVLDVIRKHTEPDVSEPGMRVLVNRNDCCTFLDGNLCMIYDARPKPCRDFPHVAPHTHTLGGRISSLCRFASVCPIIYNALEAYKRLVGYHSHRPPTPGGGA